MQALAKLPADRWPTAASFAAALAAPVVATLPSVVLNDGASQTAHELRSAQPAPVVQRREWATVRRALSWTAVPLALAAAALLPSNAARKMVRTCFMMFLRVFDPLQCGSRVLIAVGDAPVDLPKDPAQRDKLIEQQLRTAKGQAPR